MSRALSPLKIARSEIADSVSQNKLRAFYQLQQEYWDIRARYIAEFEKIRHLLVDEQLTQAPGKYALRPKERRIRRPSWKGVVIRLKGEKYAQAELEATEPKVYWRLDFEDIGSNK